MMNLGMKRGHLVLEAEGERGGGSGGMITCALVGARQRGS